MLEATTNRLTEPVSVGNNFAGRPSKKSEDGEKGTVSESVNAAGTTPSNLTKSAQKILRIQKQPPAPTLFLGNLGFDVTEDSIRELFEAHGNFRKSNTKGKDKDKDTNDSEEGKGAGIRKIRMGTFEDSGKCKGSVLLTAKIILSLTITFKVRFRRFYECRTCNECAY